MPKRQGLIPLWAAMVVETFNRRCWLLEADIIEAGKRSTVDIPYCVIWHQKLLLWKLREVEWATTEQDTDIVALPLAVMHNTAQHCTTQYNYCTALEPVCSNTARLSCVSLHGCTLSKPLTSHQYMDFSHVLLCRNSKVDGLSHSLLL